MPREPAIRGAPVKNRVGGLPSNFLVAFASTLRQLSWRAAVLGNPIRFRFFSLL